MGTRGYERAAQVDYRAGEVILEVGAGESTWFLTGVGPSVHSIDVGKWGGWPPDVEWNRGFAEQVLKGWNRPIGFAWLDGWDFPYDGNPPEYYAEQKAAYAGRGCEYSQEASRNSHLSIVRHIAGYARVIAFDDTWRTHAFVTDAGTIWCDVPVPPATTPAPALAMDQPYVFRTLCGLEADHPHHNAPDRGWDGKGGLAIPWLLDHGYSVTEYGLGLVVLTKEEA